MELTGGQIGGNVASETVTVATTVVVTSDADPSNPPVYGNAVTFTATVSAASSGYGTPGGAVEFWDESTGANLGSGSSQAASTRSAPATSTPRTITSWRSSPPVTVRFSSPARRTLSIRRSMRQRPVRRSPCPIQVRPTSANSPSAIRSRLRRPSARRLRAAARRPGASSFTTARPTLARARRTSPVNGRSVRRYSPWAATRSRPSTAAIIISPAASRTPANRARRSTLSAGACRYRGSRWAAWTGWKK